MGKHGRGDCGRRGRFSSSPGNWYFSGGAFVMFRAARKAENDERRRIWNLVACASPVNWSRWRETRSCHCDERQKFDAMASFARKQKRNRTNENSNSTYSGLRDWIDPEQKSWYKFHDYKKLGAKAKKDCTNRSKIFTMGVVDALRAKYALFAVCGKNT